MERTFFENLEVYKLSEKLADSLWQIIIEWENFSKNTVGIQLIRACDSIGANISEGFGRGSKNDNRRFVRIARGSLFEVKHWLRRAVRRNLLTKKQIMELKPIIDELSPRLSAYINSLS
ncbi:MAG: four helix bundle protein [Bacteroidetes bacterium]|nr:four helix bundle protein [Bacteroidota bacterium]MCL6099270.1 four helix bundle protein [Bacteroidota bacterium]